MWCRSRGLGSATVEVRRDTSFALSHCEVKPGRESVQVPFYGCLLQKMFIYKSIFHQKCQPARGVFLREKYFQQFIYNNHFQYLFQNQFFPSLHTNLFWIQFHKAKLVTQSLRLRVGGDWSHKSYTWSQYNPLDSYGDIIRMELT